MNRADLIISTIPTTQNIWSQATEKRSKLNELLSKQQKIQADREDLRKKITAHLSTISK